MGYIERTPAQPSYRPPSIRRWLMNIGDTIWMYHWDERPIIKQPDDGYKYKEYIIIGETSRSWIVLSKGFYHPENPTAYLNIPHMCHKIPKKREPSSRI